MGQVDDGLALAFGLGPVAGSGLAAVGHDHALLALGLLVDRLDQPVRGFRRLRVPFARHGGQQVVLAEEAADAAHVAFEGGLLQSAFDDDEFPGGNAEDVVAVEQVGQHLAGAHQGLLLFQIGQLVRAVVPSYHIHRHHADGF